MPHDSRTEDEGGHHLRMGSRHQGAGAQGGRDQWSQPTAGTEAHGREMGGKGQWSREMVRTAAEKREPKLQEAALI